MLVALKLNLPYLRMYWDILEPILNSVICKNGAGGMKPVPFAVPYGHGEVHT